MPPTPLLPAALLAAAALGLAACGGGSPGRSTPATGTAPTAAQRAAGARVAARCSQALRAEHALAPAVRLRLEAVCATAAGGDERELGQAAASVCEQLIERSSLPVGTAREQALKACHQP